MSKNYTNLKMLYLVSLLAIVVVSSVTNAAPIGSVEFTGCLQTDDSIDCDEMMIVTVPISFGVSTDMEFVTLSRTPDPCDRPIEEAVQLEITKSVPKLSYPLRYFHTVPYYPHEEVIKAPYPIDGCPGCIDCAGAEFPTCGWIYQGNIKLPHSQGFCIIKSLWELEHSDWSCSLFRGEEILGEKATADNAFSTGHHMLPGEVFFDGYEISEYTKSYEIKIKIIQGSEEHEFALRPNDPLYSTKYDRSYAGTFNMKAELIGDMEPYSGALELDNYILYIPSSPDTHEMVIDYQNNMLLVPREEVSIDGSEADKVGVSFKTFRSLGSDYKVSEAGDGLGNQLFHKHNSDLQKLTTNPAAETTYLVHGKKAFKGSMEFYAGMPKVLEHKISYINNSLVSLTVDKAIIKSITTQSKGIILFAEVETFTSMSDDGVLNVLIKNIGDYKTDYIVTVTKPTDNILKGVPAQARILQPDDEVMLKFDVSTVFNLDTSNKFLVSLYAPHGKLYDEVWVVFDTKKHGSEYSWEKYEKNKASDFSIADVDMTAPQIIINGPNTITLECGVEDYVELGAEAIDDTDPNVEVVIGGDIVDSSTCGIYEVTYSATDSACNSAQVTRTVQVEDNFAPVITLNGPDPVVLACGDIYVEPGATAADDCDDDVLVVIGGTVDTSTPGTYLLTYDATDDSGNSAVQVTRTVTVQAGDTTPPQLTVSVSPDILWPPNHKMVLITCTVTATDDQDESPEVTFLSITSNEDDNGRGDGNTRGDILITDDGSIYLRAERAGGGIGRVYTITYQAVDGAGNVTQTSATVTVPSNAP